MRERGARVALCWTIAALSCLVIASSIARADECATTSAVGLDTSYIDTWFDVGPIPGYAQGETFFAPDTVILSITLWRVWYDTPEGSVWHIFVIGVDSAGIPDVQNIIRDGPTLWIPYGDNVHPTPFKFVFDLPVHLPSPGLYELAVQGDACNGNFLVAGDSHNDYPDGISWRHSRETICEYHPRAYPTPYPDVDLAFEVEFCATSTPTRPISWGAIKALYR